jgi:hypothetical protein
MGNRVQEAGKLKIGVKTGNAMKAIDTWRFLSPHRDQLDQLAAQYGGTVKPFTDPKANPKDQFELISTSAEIRVLLPPGGLSQNYEHWSGARCERRCDGEQAIIPSRGPDGFDTVDCLCFEQQLLQCKIKTRLTVVFPDITFRGTWTLTTGSWNAADELVAMEGMIDQLQLAHDIINVNLTIEKRSRMTTEGKRNFVVPVLSIPGSIRELSTGAGGLGLGQGAETPSEAPLGAITAGTRHLEAVPDDPEPAEAELLADAGDVAAEIQRIANLLIMDAEAIEVGLCLGVSDGAARELGDLDDDMLNAADRFLEDVRADRIEIRGIQDDQRLRIKRKG